MPTPIFELQQALTEIGKVRAGDKTEKGAPRRLNAWRITSSDEEVVKNAAELYGGESRPWRSPSGDEFEVYTERAELPIYVMPGHALRQQYELWEGLSKCTRRCDGIEESISGGPCICNAKGVDECDLYTRLTVVLPELETSCGFRLDSKGWNAARELRGAMTIAAGIATGPWVPGVLRLTERRGQQNGQTTRFVVPVIDFRFSWANASALIGTTVAPRELPPAPEQLTYTPLEEEARRKAEGATLDVGLEAVTKEDARRKTSRSAEEISPSIEPSTEPIDVEDPEAQPVSPPTSPEEPPAPTPAPEPEKSKTETEDKLATAPMKKKLDVLVGDLRDKRGIVETKHLWGAMRDALVSRGVNPEPVPDDNGEIHWAPLRELLTRKEAHVLMERLEKLQSDLDAAEENG